MNVSRLVPPASSPHVRIILCHFTCGYILCISLVSYVHMHVCACECDVSPIGSTDSGTVLFIFHISAFLGSQRQ